jgi:hypothetical protein
MRSRVFGAAIVAVMTLWLAPASGQTPVPFPRPGQPSTPPAPKPPVTPADAVPSAPAPGNEPTEANLGVPLYPGAQFITSYDAGRGQRYYLFGTNTPFADIVVYYKTVLKQRGELVFEAPATHMFDIGRFREETMAFPPSVTVKDYTWGGSQGYLNPKRGAQPARFSTIVQIVPMLPGSAR